MFRDSEPYVVGLVADVSGFQREFLRASSGSGLHAFVAFGFRVQGFKGLGFSGLGFRA